MSTYEDFFARYRQLVSTEQEIQQAHRDLETAYRNEREALHQKHRKCDQEIGAMRRVITAMIEKGWDPVEAQLKMDEEMHRDLDDHTLWDRDIRIQNQDWGTIGIGQLSTMSSIGITGATGAVGATYDSYSDTWKSVTYGNNYTAIDHMTFRSVDNEYGMQGLHEPR